MSKLQKKIAILGTVGLPAKYGGFETLAHYLTKYLSHDYDTTVYCSTRNYDEKISHYNGAVLKYINLKANGVQSILYDIISIVRACRTADTLLILGVSGCMILQLISQITSTKLIVNIDGLEWKRHKWNKYAKWFLKFSEKQAIKHADVVITDNKVIQDYVLEQYGNNSELIAYGADHVKKLPIDGELLQEFPFLQHKYALSVCRIEPENNLHVIMEAMAQQDRLTLVIVGNWDSNKYGQELRAMYADNERIIPVNSIYDQVKLNKIRSNCMLYIHGHSAGGTNPSLVEAMQLELPIFAYDVPYNRETTERQAKYFSTSAELVKLIKTTEEICLATIAKKMYMISERRYRWRIISDQYANLF